MDEEGYSGRLARNTCVIYLQVGDRFAKAEVIPDVLILSQGRISKGAS